VTIRAWPAGLRPAPPSAGADTATAAISTVTEKGSEFGTERRTRVLAASPGAPPQKDPMRVMTFAGSRTRRSRARSQFFQLQAPAPTLSRPAAALSGEELRAHARSRVRRLLDTHLVGAASVSAAIF